VIPLRKELFRKVAVIGVGLIGGSLGLAIKERRLAREVVGYSQRQSSLAAAMKNKVVDHVSHDVKKAVANADLVILSTPVSVIANLLKTIGPFLKRNCIVTDVGSTKVSIVNVAHQHLPPYVSFVGSHPMAGSEKKGVQFARSDLFHETLCFMTPMPKTNKGACDRVKRFWIRLGARVKNVSPEEHDRVLAYISHLPHLVAYALIGTLPPSFTEYCAQGFKDTTRIAASTPQIWADISLGNAKNIVKALDEMVKNLSVIRKGIRMQDQKSLLNFLKQAKARRDLIG